jgi:hypothetical protein
MLLMERHTSITLEVLDTRRNAISSATATLRYLDGEMAAIELPPDSGSIGLHWGARVRFYVGTGAHGFEIQGAVVGRKSANSDDYGAVQKETPAEVCVRLFECRPMPQRRSMPRRRVKLPVRILVLTEPDGDCAGRSRAMPAWNGPVSACVGEWRDATLIDMSCSSVRMRVEGLASAPKRVVVHFTLPEYQHPTGTVPSRAFEFPGYVVRSEPAGRRAGCLVLAIKFDSLGVEDGLALANFVSG